MKIWKKKFLATTIVAILITNMSVTWADKIGIDTINKDINVKDTYKSVEKEESTYIKNYVSESKNANTVVNIPDINLKNEIYRALGKESNESITKGELESLTSLYLSFSEITNLEGIQNCINLEYLSLGGNNISDIKPLSNLVNLSELHLANNNISDIKPLSNLVNLTELYLANNNISDIRPLSNLVNLIGLDLSNNNINEISTLSKLVNLTYLCLDMNEISYLGGIQNCINLKFLELPENNISDIKPLSNLVNLIGLDLSNNNINDISILSKLTNLSELSLSSSNLDDISILSKLTNLDTLDLSNNNISDINALSNITYASELNLSNNEISDISALSNVVEIGELDLSNNKVSDITPLLNCKYTYWGEGIFYKIDLNKNNLNLKDSKTIEVIKYLESIGFTVYYEDQSVQIQFNDIKGHWAQSQIISFVSNGYVGGYPDGTFKPNNSITRAEFIKIFNKYFGLTKTSGKVFNDTKTHWAKTEIDIAVTNGVANGISATEFKPNDPITREQAAVMICNYKKISDKNHDKINNYSDKKNVSSWAKDSVEGVIEKGYMSGYSDNTFRPKNNITRAEAVVTLSRIIK